jgi:1-deoxypentalenic acid 11beta-hydroxylase
MGSPMPSKPIGTFRVANDLIADTGALKSLLADEGYLFFRGVLDVDQVLTVKRDLVHSLQEQGLVAPGSSEPIWTGAGMDRVNDVALYSLSSYQDLSEGSAKMLVTNVFGEAAFMFKNPNIRYALPEHAMYITPAHQDSFFIRGTTSFCTLWIPLMDLDESMGGLALAAGSHKRGLREHIEQQDVYSYVFKGRRQKGVSLQEIDEPWLSLDYHPGDVLVFHNLTLHWGLPNRSDRIRLSIDTRAQPASAPRTFQLEKTILELRQYRAEVQRIATEAGASPAVFEAALIEMMRRGLPANRDPVEAVIAEFGRQ